MNDIRLSKIKIYTMLDGLVYHYHRLKKNTSIISMKVKLS